MIRRITILLHFPGDAEPVDVSHLYRDSTGSCSERLFNDDKKSVQDTFSFALIHNQVIADKIRASYGKISCKVFNTQTSAALFSGVIEPNATQGSHQVNEPIHLEAVDSTWRLDELVAVSFQFPSTLNETPLKVCDYSDPANSIFHQVCYLAGYVSEDLVTGVSNTATVQHCSAKAGQETYRQFLDGILFEHLLVLDDDGQGRLTTREWTRTDSSYDMTLDSKDLSVVEPVVWQRRYIQEDGIALEWAGTQILEDALLYRESLPVTAQGEFTGQPIAAGDYYPPDSDIQDVFQEYIERWLDIPYLERQTRIKNRDISLITTDQAAAVFEADDGVVLNSAAYEWHRSKVRFRNTAAATKSIYKFEVRGRALIRSIVYTTTTPEQASNPKPYTSRFIFSHASAQAFANALALDVEYADFDYTFGLNYYVQPGTVIRLVNGKNNIDTRAIIRSCDFDIGRPVYRYSAVGLAEFSSLSFAESVLSPSMGPISLPGDPGVNGYRTATMTLYKWLSSAPTGSWPTGSSTYTWATGEWTMPGTANSWVKTPGAPSSGQKLYAISLVVSNNNTDPESTVTWLASPTAAVVGYAGTDGIDGDDGDPGDDGFTTEFRYAKNTSPTTGPAFTAAADNPGAAWSTTPPALSSTEYLWRIESVWQAGIRQTNWTGIVRMSGINAKNILNSFQDASDGTTGWNTSGVIETVDSYRCLAVTAPAHNFQSDNFEVLPDDILELSFAIATPAHTGGSGLFFGLTTAQLFQRSQWNTTTKTWGTLTAAASNQYFVTNYLTVTKTFFKTYILGSNVDISRAPAPETGAGHLINLLKLLPGAITCQLRTGYNATNTGNKWQLFHPRLVNRAGGLIIAQNIAAGSITANEVNSQSFFTTDFQISTTGKIWAGSPDYENEAGMFLGRDGGQWKFSLGNKLKWNGSVLEIDGEIIAAKIKASGFLENSNGTMRIYDTTDSEFSRKGLAFANNSRAFLAGTIQVGDVLGTIDRYTSGDYSGMTWSLHTCRTNGAFDDQRYAQSRIDFGPNKTAHAISRVGYLGGTSNTTNKAESFVFAGEVGVPPLAGWALERGDGSSNKQASVIFTLFDSDIFASIHPDNSYAAPVDIGRNSAVEKFRNGYFSGTVSAAAPAAAEHLTRKDYVDAGLFGGQSHVAANFSANLTVTLPSIAVGETKIQTYKHTNTHASSTFTLTYRTPSGGTYTVSLVSASARANLCDGAGSESLAGTTAIKSFSVQAGDSLSVLIVYRRLT